MEQSKEQKALQKPLDFQAPGRTLLPSPIASAVSLATRSTSLAIRIGSFFGSYSLDAARFTTLSSLELARGMVEGVLSRAGRDTVAVSSGSDLAANDAETILEKSLETLHYTVTQVVFWTSASFQLTGTTLSAASDVSQLVLSSCDQLFGSTDSSRAIASIITLIRREFDSKGPKIAVIDLMLALSALAYLQQACRRSVQEERRRQAYEEVIWDVVVLNDGERIDIHENSLSGIQKGNYNRLRPGSRNGGQHDTLQGLSSSGSNALIDGDESTIARLKDQITATLPAGTTVSISNSVSSVQTITVNVDGPQPFTLPALPGAEMIEAKPTAASTAWDSPEKESSYSVVYKIQRNKERETSFRRQDDESGPTIVELKDEPLSPRDSLPSPTTEGSMPMIGLLSPTLQSSDALSTTTDEESATPSSPPLKSPLSLKTQSTQTSPAKRKSPRDRGNSASDDGDQVANQKKQRRPLNQIPSRENLRPRTTPAKKTLTRKKTDSSLSTKATDKKAGFKQVLRGSGQSLSNMWNKDVTVHEGTATGPNKPRPQWKTPGSGSSNAIKAKSDALAKAKAAVQNGPGASRPLRTPEPYPRSSSRQSFVSVHERRRDSIVSQTDSYYAGGRPASPTFVRTEVSTRDSLTRPRSANYDNLVVPASPMRAHRRIPSYTPSIYSLKTNDSQTSLVLASYNQKSAYRAADSLAELRREGFVNGSFPAAHLLDNITRYMRFSSAAYGSHFMKFLGISKDMPILKEKDDTHEDVRHFVHHTSSHADNILLASFVDPQGGADATGSTGTGMPLVHYISLDHESMAVVLACRGTLGFEDVLADLTCDYDNLAWRGKAFKVHKGVHASARRLLYGGDGRVLLTLKEALQEFPEYGLVLCGHSLGGAVTALLGVMLSQPNPDGTGFVTSAEPHSRLLTNGTRVDKGLDDIRLPSGRRIHVFAYGPPGCMSRSLCKITRGLITTVVNGNDLVPHLSLGVLHDFQAVALNFKHDENQAKAEIRQRIWAAFQDNLADRWYGSSSHRAMGTKPPSGDFNEEDRWMLSALESLRDSMNGDKLMPPGEVFALESQRVLRRDAFMLFDEQDGYVGRPARRIVLKYIKDVEARFGEVRFGTSMLIDHSPAKYEEALNKLRLGVKI